MENSTANYKNKKAFHLFVAQSYTDLVQLKREDKKEEFNSLLLKVMPEVKRYIIRKLNIAMSKHLIPRGKYKPEDIMDQLFIEAYDHFDEIENKEDFHPWLFIKADSLLDEIMIDEEFDTLFIDNIDSYAQTEWDAMIEKFSVDGDGDYVMLEELDDISYRRHDYILKNIFLEDSNKDMMAKLDKDLGKENIRKHTEMVLHHLPANMRTVFELFTEHQFEVAEISKILNVEILEIEQLLEDARSSLETTFYKRFVNGFKKETI